MARLPEDMAEQLIEIYSNGKKDISCLRRVLRI